MIVFIDESGFSQRPVVRRTWGRRGDTPILVERVVYGHFSAIGALGYHPKRRQVRLFLSLGSRTIKKEDIVKFLKYLRRHVRGRMVLVLDNLPAHRSKVVEEYFEAQKEWLQVEWLPAYAPELNPVVDVWANLDGRELANFVPDNLEHLRGQVRRGAGRIRRHEEVLWGFLKHTELVGHRDVP
jgi:transposase